MRPHTHVYHSIFPDRLQGVLKPLAGLLAHLHPQDERNDPPRHQQGRRHIVLQPLPPDLAVHLFEVLFGIHGISLCFHPNCNIFLIKCTDEKEGKKRAEYWLLRSPRQGDTTRACRPVLAENRPLACFPGAANPGRQRRKVRIFSPQELSCFPYPGFIPAP